MRGRLSNELRAFSELARVVAAEPFAVRTILERVCDELRRAFGFSRAMAVRLNAEEGTVHAVVQQGVSWPGDEWLRLERFRFLEEARRTAHATFVRDAREEQAMPGRVRERFDVRSIVAVPLCVGDSCFGFIVGDREGAHFDLGHDELEMLTALGRVAAVFLVKADEYAALERSVEELRRVDAAKSDFISIASHELRTPITVVHGITTTLHLRGSELREQQVVDLRSTLFAQTTRLTALVDQLLDLSRLESGALSLNPERFRPRQQIDGLLPQLVPERLGDIRVEIEPELELYTDPHAVERVVSNLVVNALRYGEPPVYVRNQANGAVRLVVEDQGRGVDPEFVPRLFERFSRSVASRAMSEGAAGLGLSIARSYAQALGGELIYETIEPTGARFSLVLPREATALA
jgi:signal transduction histidine kinase